MLEARFAIGAGMFSVPDYAPLWVAEIHARMAKDIPVADPIDTEWLEFQRTAVQPVYVRA